MALPRFRCMRSDFRTYSPNRNAPAVLPGVVPMTEDQLEAWLQRWNLQSKNFQTTVEYKRFSKSNYYQHSTWRRGDVTLLMVGYVFVISNPGTTCKKRVNVHM